MLRALGFSRWVHSSPLRPRLVILAEERRRALAGRAITPLSLSYTVFDGPSSQPPLIFLHGLFGSKTNFQSLAKKLVLQTGRQVLTVDARNHGSSPHSSLMSYEAMSADVHLLLHQLHLNRCVLIGHSMGGKTAMVLSLQRVADVGKTSLFKRAPAGVSKTEPNGPAVWFSRKPELVERLVCVDISPSETSAVTSFQAFVAAMQAVNIPRGVPRSTARRLAEEQLRSTIQEPAIRNFLLTNLVSSEGQFMWRVNLEAISHHLNELMSFPDFQTPYSGPALFLGGSKSEYISSNDYPEIERLFPEAEIQYVPDAGHWVHADQPQEFLTAVCNFLELPPP